MIEVVAPTVIELPLSCFDTVFRWYPDMRGPVKWWCNDNLRHPHNTIVVETVIRDKHYTATFIDPVDAMMFKMKWLG